MKYCIVEEGTVYAEGDEAVKIYYDNWKSSKHIYLTEKGARKMTKIKTSQILLPRRLVYDEAEKVLKKKDY